MMARFPIHTLAWMTAALCCVTLIFSDAHGQSATRTAPMRTSPMRSSNAPPIPGQIMQAAPGLQGYCPVCIIDMKKWVRGNPAIQAQHDGKTFYFPGEEQRQAFLAKPEKYAPALGGNCAVCRIDMNKKMPGSVQFTALHKNRLFMFPSDEIKRKFMMNPEKYANADLALAGNCAVCRVEMKQVVAGNPEFSTIHGGMRYLFPSDKQRGMFLANPAKYAVTPAPMAGSGTKGSGTR